MKKKRIRVISTILILIGILVLVSPFFGKLYVQWRDWRLMQDWYTGVDVNNTEVQSDANADPVEGYNQLQDVFSSDSRGNSNMNSEANSNTTTSSAANTQNTDTKQKPKVKKSQITLGIIEINKIKVKYPILEGASESSLLYGIGHIPGTAGLGQPGNCALAGHRNHTFGRFFNRLDEVREGDLIKISTKKTEYTYKVYEKLVVKPDDVSVIKGSKDDTVLTLITCTPIYVASHRLILHARLENKVILAP